MEEKTSEFVILQPGTPAYQDFANFINSIAYQNRNGTWINSGDPAAGSNQQLSWTVSDNVCPFLLGYDNSQSGGGGDESIWNYGNPPFSISSDI